MTDARPTSFEDFSVGQVFELGTVTVTRHEIIEFATRYDPQLFHVDEDAARRSAFGGLVASGWHTAAMAMRLYVDGLLAGMTSQGSPGVEELRWLKPVRPDDVLSGRAEILEVTASSRRTDRGTVRIRLELRDQGDDVVMHMTARGLFGRRPAA